ncbi:MAG TPA: phosphopantetheine-binding protein [Acidimicrobiia bacterium]|nr:phosphopantetheine-binding protein [Acidimicrobiia bacterium]
MNRERAYTIVKNVIHDVAPEVDLDTLVPEAELHVDLDLDSMDFLNLVTGVLESTGLEIPERDYPMLATVGGLTDYVADRAA